MYDEIALKIKKRKSQIDLAKSKVEDLKKQYDAVYIFSSNLNDSQELAQIVAQGIQQKAHDRIASVTSKCLETIFEEPYRFQIIFERKRGKTEARLVFERDGLEIEPLTASGGGVIDVASFALRLSAISLTKPHVRKIMILDEPFRFLSAEYRPRVRDMLQELAEEYGFQFVMVTHIEELICGKCIRL